MKWDDHKKNCAYWDSCDLVVYAKFNCDKTYVNENIKKYKKMYWEGWLWSHQWDRCQEYHLSDNNITENL